MFINNLLDADFWLSGKRQVACEKTRGYQSIVLFDQIHFLGIVKVKKTLWSPQKQAIFCKSEPLALPGRWLNNTFLNIKMMNLLFANDCN